MKITIIGVGLIGGSIGLALRRKKFLGEKIKITGVGRKPTRLALAKKLGAIDDYTTDITSGAKDADIIFIATPVKVIPKIFQSILPYCKPDSIITDVGSVKNEIMHQCEKILSQHKKNKPAVRKNNFDKGPFFVGSHPIAGGEKTSVVYARRDLFRNAVTVITPPPQTPSSVVNIVKKLWQATGSKVYKMSPHEHDLILARTSHLPHIAAYALTNSIALPKDKNFTGPGWRDTTRIAASSPTIWAEILNSNKNAAQQALRKFKKNIAAIERSLSDEKSLIKIFSKAKSVRDSITRE